WSSDVCSSDLEALREVNRTFWVAHASRVSGDRVSRSRTFLKDRFGETRKPARGTRALPTVARYAPGLGDCAGAGGLLCGCAPGFSVFGAPGGATVPGVGPTGGSPGGRCVGAGAFCCPASSARSFNHCW